MLGLGEMYPARLIRLLPEIGGEAGVVVAAYVAYSVLRVVVEGDDVRAFDNALQLVRAEQSLGLFHEVAIQRLVASSAWLHVVMEWIYLWAYLPILIGSALLLYLRDRELYRTYRKTLFISAGIGLLIFAVLPVAPPRMLPESGFEDSMHAAVAATSGAKNDFAAVPSFHFGFTLLAALGVAHAFRFRPWLVALVGLMPVVMLLSIVATGNHYFIDAVAGGSIVIAVWWIVVARGLDRALPRGSPIYSDQRL